MTNVWSEASPQCQQVARFARWLEILPLGEASSRAVGVGLTASRFRLLLVTAMLTGAATLIVGPLSFVGLMAPHMARMTGLQRPMPQLCGAAIIGALIMLLADWLGRNLLFPYQVPAGLLATFIGGPYFMKLRARGERYAARRSGPAASFETNVTVVAFPASTFNGGEQVPYTSRPP